MSPLLCPDDEQLWPLAFGNGAQADVVGHVAGCFPCRERADRLRQDCHLVRAAARGPALAAIADDDSVSFSCEWSEFAFSASTSGSGEKSRVRPPSTGVIGKYRLTECLNQGGQGIVYRAWDPQLNRDVAIKLSRKRLEGDQPAVSWILREGSLLAQIDHPHLARIYDCGVHDGFPYLVMEFVRGLNLREYADACRLTDREIRRILTEVSTALAAVHRQRILHLDLKPENVMVTLEGRCKLIDFGMAWLLTQRDLLELRVVAGTPEYMSPEQRSGKTADWTPATDIFGLGGLLCFLLTGHPPLPGPSRIGESAEQWLEETLRQLKRGVTDKGLGQACRRALSPDPQSRQPSADAFRRELIRSQQIRQFGSICASIGICMLLCGLLLLPRPAERRPVKPFTSRPVSIANAFRRADYETPQRRKSLLGLSAAHE